MKTDNQIRQDILDELGFDPSVASENIAVSVSDGVVTLSGFVPSFADKYSAEKAAFRVAGVKAVAEEIEVKLPPTNTKSDQEVAKAAADAIRWNVSLPSTIQISVEDGVVILRGEVDWQYQRDAATSAVRYITGVRSVKNHLAIHQRPQPTDIKIRIEQALIRSAEADAKRIRVSTANGRVSLSGTVRSQAEIQDAKWAAWAAPGVTAVETNLAIE
ncbi:MAG: BON domain-containing protein [Deltaproteobacteria bacterium]|nr:BON domain-containing protein [Deltaproteobacteria bacterium]